MSTNLNYKTCACLRNLTLFVYFVEISSPKQNVFNLKIAKLTVKVYVCICRIFYVKLHSEE